MVRILIDTNIILDLALRREPFYNDSANVLKKIDNNSVFGFVTATTITDIYYIAKKDKGHSIAIEFITNLIQFVDLIGIDKEIIIESLAVDISDFEDAIQSVASAYNDIDYIITRNTKDYKSSKVKAIVPAEFINLTKKKN
jgi:predicted nucleic acid-binding protein